jgi:hypothetical protein
MPPSPIGLISWYLSFKTRPNPSTRGAPKACSRLVMGLIRGAEAAATSSPSSDFTKKAEL